MQGENTCIEYKAIYTDDIKKEIIALANSQGGTIYIGIEDDGRVIGVSDPDDVMLRVAGTCRDAISPDVTMFVDYEVKEMAEKPVVLIHVQRGTGRPYYITAKGMRPAGIYVRQGTSSAPASEAAIRDMIREADAGSYEELQSRNQNLTFRVAAQVFSSNELEFGNNQMRSLGLTNADGKYTNLGLLLSDQCPHIIKGAHFKTRTKEAFLDRREFEGSLFQQINEAYQYLDLLNQLQSSFHGLYRYDRRDYPEVALREALLNAVVHRDYGRSAPTLISVFEDRVEMVSIGGLPTDVELDDIMLGLSVCRNEKLANIFYRLNMIEAYGTGMGKIFSSYEEGLKKPVIQTSSHAFKIQLPNQNVKDLESNGRSPLYSYDVSTPGIVREHGISDTDYLSNGKTYKGSDYEGAAIELIRVREEITRQELQEYLGVSLSTANRVLKALLGDGRLVQNGRGKNTRYRLNVYQ